MSYKTIVFVVLIYCIQQIVTENDAIRAVNEFKTKTNPNVYDKDISPKLGQNSSVNVIISLHIINRKINANDKSVKTYMYFRQTWTDPRLGHSYPGIKVVGSQPFIDRIWIPDTFFSNADSNQLSTVSVPKPTTFVTIDSNGTIRISHKLEPTTRCYVEDDSRLVCPIEIESYGYNVNDLDYRWDRSRRSVSVSNPQVSIDGYTFRNIASIRTVRKLSTGNFAKLVVTMTFDPDTV
ncbi:gamma-aminobutyric acid receptor subunit beta-like [Oppia nitens]|uniref:gamma-aminobutyric acid receptor subunit beta-like n=1 Tax=Oppia nitens TaxID=1686743 RepID=UPI0023DBFFC3|nr:gamma-aminobutyric acid receptor subunit beta-like [Oppia nitens]